LATRFDVDRQTLFIEHDVGVFESNLSTGAGRQAAEGFFATYMGGDLRERPRFESAPGHSFSDLEAKVISIINLASVKDLSASVGAVLDPLRFRGNIYIEGLPAWQEFEWLDREIGIGNVRLEVIKRTQRCAATNVNPKTAKRDHNLPKALQQAYGHADLGIYARVIEGEGISLGEVIQLLGYAVACSASASDSLLTRSIWASSSAESWLVSSAGAGALPITSASPAPDWSADASTSDGF